MRRLIAPMVILAAGACAEQELPLGGPERHVPPKLTAIQPESGAVNVTNKSVQLFFDEVVAERPAGGAQRLSDLVLISPRDGEPRVGWHRSRLELRGDRDWKANTAYTVTLRPGLVDLHGNILRSAVVVIFSTGASIPATVIRGVVFDWGTGKPIPNALIQSFLPPDSTQYITVGDSSGRFALATLPAGSVTVRGMADVNNNRALEPREPWDTATVVLRDSVTLELYAFVHDTSGPHLNALETRDSVTLHAGFDKPLDPAAKVDTANFALRGPDSAVIPLVRVLPAADYDLARADSSRRADSIAGKADTAAARRRALASAAAIAKAHGVATDTVPKIPPPVPHRAIAVSDFVIVLSRPLATGVWYRLDAHGVRNLLGDSASSFRSVQRAKPPPPPPPAPPPPPRPPRR